MMQVSIVIEDKHNAISFANALNKIVGIRFIFRNIFIINSKFISVTVYPPADCV